MKEQVKNISLPLTATIREGLQAIDRGALGVALLVDPETQIFKGIVTDGDVRRALLKGYGFQEPLFKLMCAECVTVEADTPFNEILELFSPVIRIIPVLDTEKRVIDIAVYDKRLFLPVAEPSIGEKEWEYVSECVLSGWVSSTGNFINRFEEMFAKFCNVKHAITTSNGTTALHLALLACGIGPGDEVIVPTLTFIATANAVTFTGAKPVFVDSELETWNMDPAKLEAAITSRTKAIIPVHLYGHPANMEPILETAKRHGLVVIEDAAEAHGALFKGKVVGAMGELGVFSFFGNKIVTTGEGGMVVTDNDEYAKKIRMLRDHGMDKTRRYWHPILGYNYRLTNLQAALGVAQMEKIDYLLSRKRQIAEGYNKLLSGVEGIVIPPEASWAKSVYWLYTILIDKEKFGLSRDELMEKLRERGVETRPIFYPIHLQPVYDVGQKFAVAEFVSLHGISLPSSGKLRDEAVRSTAKTIIELGQVGR